MFQRLIAFLPRPLSALEAYPFNALPLVKAENFHLLRLQEMACALSAEGTRYGLPGQMRPLQRQRSVTRQVKGQQSQITSRTKQCAHNQHCVGDTYRIHLDLRSVVTRYPEHVGGPLRWDSFPPSGLGCNRQPRICRSAANAPPSMSIACNTRAAKFRPGRASIVNPATLQRLSPDEKLSNPQCLLPFIRDRCYLSWHRRSPWLKQARR